MKLEKGGGGLASLMPFRGASVHDGAAFEVGALLEVGKPVHGRPMRCRSRRELRCSQASANVIQDRE